MTPAEMARLEEIEDELDQADAELFGSGGEGGPE